LNGKYPSRESLFYGKVLSSQQDFMKSSYLTHSIQEDKRKKRVFIQKGDLNEREMRRELQITTERLFMTLIIATVFNNNNTVTIFYSRIPNLISNLVIPFCFKFPFFEKNIVF